MTKLAYLGRLGFHGGKLLARVLVILLPVVGAALWKLIHQASATEAAEPTRDQWLDRNLGYYSDGTPFYENSSDSQWAAYYGEPK